MLVATLQPPDGAFDFTRAVDAATGAAIGLLVGSVLLPVDPQRLVGARHLAPVIDGLAAALDFIARAVEDRDEAEADRAVEAVAQLRPEHDELEDSIAAAADAARLSLGRREALLEIGKLSSWPATFGSPWRTPARWRAGSAGRSRPRTPPRPR